MNEKSNGTTVMIDVGALKTTIRETVKETFPISDGAPPRLSAASYSPETFSAPRAATSPLKLNPAFEPHANDSYTLGDLLRYHDREFIQNAYRAILKREPDEAGRRASLGHLRAGDFDKVDILAALRFSAEGVRRGVRVEGLKLAHRRRQLGRLPIIGYLFRWVIAVLMLPKAAERAREFQAYCLAQQQTIVDDINDANRRIMAAHEHLASDLRGLREDIGVEIRRIERQQREAMEHAKAEIRAGVLEAGTHTQGRVEAVGKLVEERVRQFDSRLRALRAEATLTARRTTLLLEEMRRRPSAPPAGDEHRVPEAEAEHVLDALYLTFEDEYRGSRGNVKDRLRVYLPSLAERGITDRILDIGCGRGEWLELLRDESFAARGIDVNKVMIEACRTRGLDVTEADAIAHLRSLPPDGLRLITSFHLVEHLELETLLAFLDECLRVLAPGGLLILETPNPENIIVGSCNFYLDPTHKRPLPSQLLSFLLEARGFCDIAVTKLHPLDAERLSGTDETTQRFNAFFYGPMDYSVRGRKI